MRGKLGMCMRILVTLGLVNVLKAQNTSECSGPDMSSAQFGFLEETAKSVVYNFIAGEMDVDGQDFMMVQKVLEEEELKYIKKYLQFLDPKKMKRSPYHEVLETGNAPHGSLAEVKIEWIIEQHAIEILNSIQGPAKIALEVIRAYPELKYNPDGLVEKIKMKLDDLNFGNTKLSLVSSYTYNYAFTSEENAIEQCQADLNYLFVPLVESLSCLIRVIITNIVKDLFDGECYPCIGRLCFPDLNFCPNVTTPSREVPGATGTFIDAQFKPPPGITQGNLHWPGSYYQCNRIQDVTYNTSLLGVYPAEMRTFKSRYCRAEIRAGASENSSGIPLYLGVCVPDSCSTPEVVASVTGNYTILGLKVVDMYCGLEPVVLEENAIAMATTVIGLTLLIIVSIASIYDMLIRKPYLANKLKKMTPNIANGIVNDLPVSTSMNNGSVSGSLDNIYSEMSEPGDKGLVMNGKTESNTNLVQPPSFVSQVSTMSTSGLINNELGAAKQTKPIDNFLDEPPGFLERLEGAFVAFSAYSNIVRVFDTQNISDRLVSCDSVRFLSVVWSTYGLTWLFGTIYTEAWTTANLLPVILNTTKEFFFQVINNFTFSADSAFVVAGCVLTYNWMRQYDRNKKITWKTIVHHYLHRYIRLALPLILALISYTFIAQTAVSGPLSPPSIEDAVTCKSQWYISMLLVHNIVNKDNMCLSWTLHVGMVFQFHIVAPLILIPLVLKPWIGAVVGGLIYLANLIVLGITAGDMADGGGIGTWYEDILLAPWCRIGPFLVGMATGYALFVHKKKPFTVPVVARVGIWFCAIACLMAPIFSTYSALQDNIEWNRAQRINYQLWGRTAFGLGVAWLIFSAEIGIGGFTGRFLRYRQWVPFSHLSYMTLLVSAMFIFQNVYSQEKPFDITSHVMMYFFFGNMTISLLVALGLSMLFQFPFYEMENALFCSTRRKLIKMGRNPLKDMTEYDKIINSPSFDKVQSTPQDTIENSKPSGGLFDSPSERPLVDFNRSISQSSQF